MSVWCILYSVLASQGRNLRVWRLRGPALQKGGVWTISLESNQHLHNCSCSSLHHEIACIPFFGWQGHFCHGRSFSSLQLLTNSQSSGSVSIADLKKQIADKIGISPGNLLVFAELQDDKSVLDYFLQDQSALQVSIKFNDEISELSSLLENTSINRSNTTSSIATSSSTTSEVFASPTQLTVSMGFASSPPTTNLPINVPSRTTSTTGNQSPTITISQSSQSNNTSPTIHPSSLSQTFPFTFSHSSPSTLSQTTPSVSTTPTTTSFSAPTNSPPAIPTTITTPNPPPTVTTPTVTTPSVTLPTTTPTNNSGLNLSASNNDDLGGGYVRGSMELDGPPPSFEDIDSTQPMPLPPAYTENHVASPSISHELLSQQMTGTSSITNGANISLVIWYGPAPFLIPVNKATATVGFLKTLVERKAGVLASKQILKTLRGQFLTPDSKLLSDFNVEAEPDIQLEETQTHNGNALVSSIRVRLLSRGSSVFHVDIDLDLRVESLKAKIEQKVNIAPSSQKLVFKGSILQNERTLTSYGIQSQSELFLFLLTKDTSQISVLHYGDMYKVDSYDVRPLDKLSYLKAKIAEADGYGNFTIWFKGKPLTDDKEIASYGIIDGSKVLVR